MVWHLKIRHKLRVLGAKTWGVAFFQFFAKSFRGYFEPLKSVFYDSNGKNMCSHMDNFDFCEKIEIRVDHIMLIKLMFIYCWGEGWFYGYLFGLWSILHLCKSCSPALGQTTDPNRLIFLRQCFVRSSNVPSQLEILTVINTKKKSIFHPHPPI